MEPVSACGTAIAPLHTAMTLWVMETPHRPDGVLGSEAKLLPQRTRTLEVSRTHPRRPDRAARRALRRGVLHDL